MSREKLEIGDNLAAVLIVALICLMITTCNCCKYQNNHTNGNERTSTSTI